MTTTAGFPTKMCSSIDIEVIPIMTRKLVITKERITIERRISITRR